MRFRPKGERALVSELMAKGVARETIDLVLGEADPDAETKRAREVIRRPMTRWLAINFAHSLQGNRVTYPREPSKLAWRWLIAFASL